MNVRVIILVGPGTPTLLYHINLSYISVQSCIIVLSHCHSNSELKPSQPSFSPPRSTLLNATPSSTVGSLGASLSLPFLLNKSINDARFPSGLVPGDILNTFDRRRGVPSGFVRGGYMTSDGLPVSQHISITSHHTTSRQNIRIFPAPPIP
jgi:hypothetical protein